LKNAAKDVNCVSNIVRGMFYRCPNHLILKDIITLKQQMNQDVSIADSVRQYALNSLFFRLRYNNYMFKNNS
jgi:hypothetical protein